MNATHTGPVLALAAFLLLLAVVAVLGALRLRIAALHDLAQAAGLAECVDPWRVQRDIMERSGQRLPSAPLLHNGSVLYACLSMEELGETLEALGDAIAAHCDVTVPRSAYLALEFRKLGQSLERRSRSIRDMLGDHDIGAHPMSHACARALLDGTSDLTVTNCGFALSCGFPGSAAYAEVQDSNLSKANPATGLIDKTADGKWIKGVHYVEPNLGAVLQRHSPGWNAR